MSRKVAIGIDLGTTNSCVGVFKDGKVDIIANGVGSRITPSIVAFTDQECLVGSSAKEQASVNIKNTVFEAKRLIGRRFADASVQNDIKQWPFEVLDDNGAPKIRVQYRTEVKVLTPEEISAMVLAAMKEVADTYIGTEVLDAVITVPAYFNDSQRQATMDAGKIAGLNVLHILNEPTAAALAYGFDKKIIGNQNILVFDLGGGTFDVAILSIAGNDFRVVAVGGDTHLGGGDFDSRLVEHYLATIKRKHGKDITGNRRAVGRLRSACESVKLSSSLKTNLDVACLFDGIDFRESITRKRFEELCSDLFQKTIEHVNNVIEDSGISKDQIQEVILVGGSSRIPKIKELLSVFFSGKKLNSTINPDEAVAYGAAVRAALASGENTIEEITLTDVVPLSLGKKNHLGEMKTFIRRNTRIPITVTQNWTTTEDDVTIINSKIFEGERRLAANNEILGSFEFHLGERAKAGVPKLTYTFTVDANGILHVSGTNKNTNSTAGVTIVSNKGRLSKMEVERMVEEAKTFKSGAPSEENSGPSKDSLESYCFDKKKDAQEKFTRRLLSETERDYVIRWCDEAIQWLDDNNDLPKDAYDRKLREVKFMCAPVLANVTTTPEAAAAAAWPNASW